MKFIENEIQKDICTYYKLNYYVHSINENLNSTNLIVSIKLLRK